MQIWCVYFIQKFAIKIPTDFLFQWKLVLYWGFCCLIAVVAVQRQINEAKKATTITRKAFHALAIAVFIPGYLYQCTFLYLATGITLGIFIALEV